MNPDSNAAPSFSISSSTSRPLVCSASFSWLDAPEDIRLRVGRWEPMGKIRGTVVLMGDRGDFIEKLEPIAAEWKSRNYLVLSMDWRGQGKSTRLLRSGQRGHIRSFDEYVFDFERFMNRIVSTTAEGPVMLVGLSMGALIALLYLTQCPPTPLSGVILTAPMVDLDTKPYRASVMKALATFACGAGFSEAYAFGQHQFDHTSMTFENNPLTSDMAGFEQTRGWMMRDPELRLGGVTFGWMEAALLAIQRIQDREFSGLAGLPLLVLGTQRDPIVPFGAQERLTYQLPGVIFKAFSEGRHELFLENATVRSQVWAEVDQFLAMLSVVASGGSGNDRFRMRPPPRPPRGF